VEAKAGRAAVEPKAAARVEEVVAKVVVGPREAARAEAKGATIQAPRVPPPVEGGETGPGSVSLGVSLGGLKAIHRTLGLITPSGGSPAAPSIPGGPAEIAPVRGDRRRQRRQGVRRGERRR
jgi:hypothetical protein